MLSTGQNAHHLLPASDPGRPWTETRLMHLGRRAQPIVRSVDELPELLRAGDLVVLNDAATLPASLRVEAKGKSSSSGWRLLDRHGASIRDGQPFFSATGIGGTTPTTALRRSCWSLAMRSSSPICAPWLKHATSRRGG